jgi:hypothetical protein
VALSGEGTPMMLSTLAAKSRVSDRRLIGAVRNLGDLIGYAATGPTPCSYRIPPAPESALRRRHVAARAGREVLRGGVDKGGVGDPQTGRCRDRCRSGWHG